MPKILYVEDELTKNLSAIRKYFAPVLRDKRIQSRLAELEKEDRIYPEDIIEACSSSSELDICYSFPLAVEKALCNHQYYDLILIDRNLSLYQYDDELKAIADMLTGQGYQYSQERIMDFFEREGDLLLQILLRINSSYKDKIFFLTANTKDDIRGGETLQTLIDLSSFNQNNIIQKGSSQEDQISSILSDMKAFRLQTRYRTQCDVIRKRLKEKEVSEFIDMLKYYESDKRKEFVFYLRNLLDNILHAIAYQIGEPEAEYWNKSGRNTQLQIGPFIKGFKPKNKSEFVGLDAYDKRNDIGYNSIIKYACLSIFAITSDCGVHELSKAINIESLNTHSLSKHTLRTLLNQLCDVIIWFDCAMDRIDSFRY